MVGHQAGVIHVDDGLLLHRGVVAAAVAIHDGTAYHLEIGLLLLGEDEVCCGSGNRKLARFEVCF